LLKYRNVDFVILKIDIAQSLSIGIGVKIVLIHLSIVIDKLVSQCTFMSYRSTCTHNGNGYSRTWRASLFLLIHLRNKVHINWVRSSILHA